MIYTLIPAINAINHKGSFGSVPSRLFIYSALAGTNVQMRLRRRKGDSDAPDSDKYDFSFTNTRRVVPDHTDL